MSEPEQINDPNNARCRLIAAALELFAEKGFDSASTREICDKAGANLSAIKYYFCDKAGLYKAVFTEAMCERPCKIDVDSFAHLPMEEAFALFFYEFLKPLKKGEAVRLMIKLRFRELFEPTGAWQEMIDGEIKPQFQAITALLQRHLALEIVDLDLQCLATAILSMAVHYYVNYDVVSISTPALLADSDAIDTLAKRLSSYAVAMVKAEQVRRVGGGNETI
jgi:TetR/AcrR family transcriptional regulator, regulator of cefoperazone and chloramphenicol sensitivity